MLSDVAHYKSSLLTNSGFIHVHSEWIQQQKQCCCVCQRVARWKLGNLLSNWLSRRSWHTVLWKKSEVQVAFILHLWFEAISIRKVCKFQSLFSCLHLSKHVLALIFDTPSSPFQNVDVWYFGMIRHVRLTGRSKPFTYLHVLYFLAGKLTVVGIFRWIQNCLPKFKKPSSQTGFSVWEMPTPAKLPPRKGPRKQWTTPYTFWTRFWRKGKVQMWVSVWASSHADCLNLYSLFLFLNKALHVVIVKRVNKQATCSEQQNETKTKNKLLVKIHGCQFLPDCSPELKRFQHTALTLSVGVSTVLDMMHFPSMCI